MCNTNPASLICLLRYGHVKKRIISFTFHGWGFNLLCISDRDSVPFDLLMYMVFMADMGCLWSESFQVKTGYSVIVMFRAWNYKNIQLIHWISLLRRPTVETIIFEPTCATCTMGSHASLSVCSLDLTKKGDRKKNHVSNCKKYLLQWQVGPIANVKLPFFGFIISNISRPVLAWHGS